MILPAGPGISLPELHFFAGSDRIVIGSLFVIIVSAKSSPPGGLFYCPKQMRQKLLMICGIASGLLCVVLILIGHWITFGMTQGHAFIAVWPLWVAAAVLGVISSLCISRFD